jgi:uncharacterized membrane protein YccC
MSDPAPSRAPSTELAEQLGRAEAALGRDDLETADALMAGAADLCRRLQTSGLGVPPAELAQLRELAERCGASLTRLSRALNAESLRDDNHRRGISTYLETLSKAP